jgi:hypothetical protein
VLAGIGKDFGSVDGHGAHFEELHLAGQQEDLDEGLLDERAVLAAEGAEGVVVGMGVGADVAHGHVLPCGVLNAAGTEDAGGVAVNQHTEHHLRRILGVASPAVVDAALVELEGGDRIYDEVGEVVIRDPVLDALGKQHRCLTVDILIAGSHD